MEDFCVANADSPHPGGLDGGDSGGGVLDPDTLGGSNLEGLGDGEENLRVGLVMCD